MLGRKDEWFRVRLPDAKIGWINSSLVQERLVVTGRGVRVRASASSSSLAVGTAKIEEEVGKIQEDGNWYEVQFKSGKTGWISKRYLRSKLISVGQVGERTVDYSESEVVTDEQPEPGPTTEVSTPVAEVAERIAAQPNHYAAGLRHERAGEYEVALWSFEEVLRHNPDQLSARVHAALAHKQLLEYEAALEDLYHAVEVSGGRRDLYMHIGEVYRLRGMPDSTAKYKRLYRGGASPEQEAAHGAVDEFEWSANSIWIYVGGVGGAIALGALFVVLMRRQRVPSKFDRNFKDSRTRRTRGQINAAEESELDHQIQEKWRELKESSDLFARSSDPTGVEENGLEDGHLDQLVSHLETLRQSLEMQDDRAQIYADIVRLQNQKIEAMTEEVRLLRRGRGR